MSLTMNVLLALGAGLGLFLVVFSFLPRQERFGGEIPLRDRIRRAIGRAETDLRGRAGLMQDILVAGKSPEKHALAKVIGVVAGGGVLLGVATIMSLAGTVSVPAPVLVLVAIIGAGVGWWLPDSMLRTEADKARAAFQQSTESWLELAGQLVTSGADTFAALTTAASYSDQPVFVTIRETLRASAARGEPPWTGLRRMVSERRLHFLDPFCAALELAGTTGAASRETILAQVEATRSKALHEADARAASSGEKMGAPLAMIGGAFMVLMGYPPMAGIMDSASLSIPAG